MKKKREGIYHYLSFLIPGNVKIGDPRDLSTNQYRLVGKNPYFAFLLGGLWPGLGLLYVWWPIRGFIIMALAMFLLNYSYIGVVIWVWAIFDAVKIAKAQRDIYKEHQSKNTEDS